MRVRAIYKPRVYGDAGGWHRTPMEWVAYRLNLLLGLDLVPPVAYRWGRKHVVYVGGCWQGAELGRWWQCNAAVDLAADGAGELACLLLSALFVAGRRRSRFFPWLAQHAPASFMCRTAPLTLCLSDEDEELVFQEGAMMLWVEVRHCGFCNLLAAVLN